MGKSNAFLCDAELWTRRLLWQLCILDSSLTALWKLLNNVQRQPKESTKDWIQLERVEQWESTHSMQFWSQSQKVAVLVALCGEDKKVLNLTFEEEKAEGEVIHVYNTMKTACSVKTKLFDQNSSHIYQNLGNTVTREALNSRFKMDYTAGSKHLRLDSVRMWKQVQKAFRQIQGSQIHKSVLNIAR